MMYSKIGKEEMDRAGKRDILESILNRAVPDGHRIESSTNVITANGTVIINVYSNIDPTKGPVDPDVITVSRGQQS